MYKESGYRTFIKTITYRLLGTLGLIIIAYIFTGKAMASLAIGGIDFFGKLFLYFIHERLWDKINIGKQKREPFVLWFTGLPFSGKGDIADKLYEILYKKYNHVQRIDGHDVRTLFPIKGFSKEEREAYLKRMGYFASILERNGVVVIASFISPFEESRSYNRNLAKNYIEVYVNTPLAECKKRDTYGLYQQVGKNSEKHIVGMDESYEAPKKAEIMLDLSRQTIEEASSFIMSYLKKNKFL